MPWIRLFEERHFTLASHVGRSGTPGVSAFCSVQSGPSSCSACARPEAWRQQRASATTSVSRHAAAVQCFECRWASIQATQNLQAREGVVKSEQVLTCRK